MIWLWLSAAAMVLTGLTHSLLGERKLIAPILAIDAPLLKIERARKVIRFAWHFTTLLMFAAAATIVWPDTPKGVVVMIGTVWLAVGLFDCIYTRGQHIGWPMLCAAGLLSIIGATV